MFRDFIVITLECNLLRKKIYIAFVPYYTGRAFVAGVIPFKIAQQMAKSATSVLWRTYREVPINIQAVQV